jgi:hypothetical protein
MAFDGLAYTETPGDRAASLRGDPGWVEEQLGRDDTRTVPMWRDCPLLTASGLPVALIGPAGRAVVAAASQTVLLGLDGTTARPQHRKLLRQTHITRHRHEHSTKPSWKTTDQLNRRRAPSWQGVHECQAFPQPDVLAALLLELPDGGGRVARHGRGGKVAPGASSSFDEAANLVRLLSFSPYSPWSSAYGQ